MLECMLHCPVRSINHSYRETSSLLRFFSVGNACNHYPNGMHSNRKITLYSTKISKGYQNSEPLICLRTWWIIRRIHSHLECYVGHSILSFQTKDQRFHFFFLIINFSILPKIKFKCKLLKKRDPLFMTSSRNVEYYVWVFYWHKRIDKK